MKNMDLISKRIIVISLGICMILLSAGFFVSKLDKGDHNKSVFGKNIPTQIPMGKYMMSYQAFVYADGGTGYNVLVWDTETGKSRIYYYKSGDGKMVHWTGGDLPPNPLADQPNGHIKPPH